MKYKLKWMKQKNHGFITNRWMTSELIHPNDIYLELIHPNNIQLELIHPYKIQLELIHPNNIQLLPTVKFQTFPPEWRCSCRRNRDSSACQTMHLLNFHGAKVQATLVGSNFMELPSKRYIHIKAFHVRHRKIEDFIGLIKHLILHKII